jgi:5-methylcytosine-specific restriction endonuclease McrA
MAATHGRKGRPWTRLQRQVINRAVFLGEVCPRCKQPIDPPGKWPDRHPLSPSVDHIVPLSVDPTRAHDITNLRAMHFGCNSGRGDGTHERIRREW